VSDVAIFSYLGHDVRTVLIDGEPWWVSADVAGALGIVNARNMVARLDDDQKGVRLVDTLGGRQSLTVINESGLYTAIIRSDSPRAAEFRRWVTGVVLPEIRRTGSYVVPETREQLIARALLEASSALEESKQKIAELTPRADAWNAIASAQGDYSVGDAAKMLARAGIPTGPQRLFNQLLDIKWTYRGGDGKPRAYADRVEKGYLTEKPQFHYHPGTGERVLDAPQVRITIKGIERLRQRLHVGALKAVVAS
jgi:prophage antirepressor-like protein